MLELVASANYRMLFLPTLKNYFFKATLLQLNCNYYNQTLREWYKIDWNWNSLILQMLSKTISIMKQVCLCWRQWQRESLQKVLNQKYLTMWLIVLSFVFIAVLYWHTYRSQYPPKFPPGVNLINIFHTKILFHSIYISPTIEHCTLRNVNNYLNTNIYSYLETSGGQSSNIYLKAIDFFNTSVN